MAVAAKSKLVTGRSVRQIYPPRAWNRALSYKKSGLKELEFRVQQGTEELVAANAALYSSNTRLRHTNADLDNFVYTASHDLKSPISNIEWLLLLPELLPMTLQRDKWVAPVLAHMQESAARFKHTINYLMDVSRLQAEFTQPVMPVRLADIVEDVRQDMLPQLT